jgi:stage II sporulation protein P
MTSFQPTFRLFMLLSAATLFVFALLAAFAFTQISPGMNAKGIASGLPGRLFVDVVRSQLPTKQEKSTVEGSKVAAFVLRLVTGIQLGDPATLLAEGMPPIGDDRAILFRTALANAKQITPKDYVPPKTAMNNETAPLPTITPIPTTEPSNTLKNRVFIYHSHNRESYMPALKGVTNLNAAYDQSINVTLVGKRLANQLRYKGIGSVVSTQDYKTSEKTFNYIYSYRYSLKSIQQASASNRDLAYYIDIHRDSQRRAHTTVNIGGQTYAQVYFVIGYKNKHWKQNEQLANTIQQLEQQYPGISRGVWGKNTGNAEYNQSFSPNSILIEVGGVENTLEECYRTADILGNVISTMIWGSDTKES